jgi:hypothetical protein
MKYTAASRVGGDSSGKFHTARRKEEGRCGRPMCEGVHACRNTRVAPDDGKWRFLANMFSKLLERVFLLIYQNLWDGK